jgi:hypothetical protein
LNAEADEVPESNDVGGPDVLCFQPLQRFIQSGDLLDMPIVRDVDALHPPDAA